MNHFHKLICYDKDNNYKIVSNDLYKNGIFDNNDNEIANNIARKITIPILLDIVTNNGVIRPMIRNLIPYINNIKYMGKPAL